MRVSERKRDCEHKDVRVRDAVLLSAGSFTSIWDFRTHSSSLMLEAGTQLSEPLPVFPRVYISRMLE